MNRIKKIFILLFFLLPFLFVSNQALAYDFQNKTGLSETGGKAGYNVNTQKNEIYLPRYVGTIISIILGMVGVIFLVLMIYAGYLWMTARGNEEQVTKAKNIIQASIIGLIIVVAAYGITVFVARNLVNPASQGQSTNQAQVSQE